VKPVFFFLFLPSFSFFFFLFLASLTPNLDFSKGCRDSSAEKKLLMRLSRPAPPWSRAAGSRRGQ
jgi:hypothetical protein